jgi:hypothetical protein
MWSSDRLALGIRMKSQDGLGGMGRDIGGSGFAEGEIVRPQLFRDHFHRPGAPVGGNLRSDDPVLIRNRNPRPAIRRT